MAKTPAPGSGAQVAPTESRRDFLYLATGAVGAVGGLAALWPLIQQMNPSAEVLAMSSTEVDLSRIESGQSVTVVWRGKPVFLRRRTEDEIETARAVPLDALPDPQTDEERVERAEWLILVGICTHLGCVPLSDQGDYDAWFCPCHGSHYDISGRIRKGPAPLNLEVPQYVFLDDSTVRIG